MTESPVSAQRPVAIVGMACRFPKAEGLSAFWRLLEAGENGVIEVVPGSGVGRFGELFPDAEVQSESCRFGGFLDRIDLFDAAFFRISPVEADLLDPQQRLMLETCWRALEDAGIDPGRLKGSRTGVYAGISNHDYRSLILSRREITEPADSLYAVSGTSFNTAIGRVAFALDLAGPAMALDTACSSSLVAIHQAVSALHRGEADLALAGGVHLILSGRLSELRGKAGMLAPDGRCKTFDAAANGYVRGEGCGIVVLKPLRQAEADGDRIWGVIRGSAVNQDGATPGLTVPSAAAQERVIGDALSRAGVEPSEVDYLEAHGTGTEVGDPIELEAAAAAYGKGRETDRPLLIGSVKTNIGHLEPAAGVAGLIKVVLAMQRGVIPRHLHFHEPNPRMDWGQLPLRVTSEQTAWPLQAGRPPTAGISGFGWSGTNAHVVLEGYGTPDGDAAASGELHSPAGPGLRVAVSLPEALDGRPAAEAEPAPRETRFLPLSGRSDQALGDLAGQYLSWLDERAGELSSRSAADPVLADMAWTAAIGRGHFAHRAGVVFDDVESLRDGLSALAASGAGPAPPEPSKVAFVFTGQGSHWPGMGEKLYRGEPVARAVLDRCDAVLRQDRGTSLLDVMFGRAGPAADLSDQEWTQPAIYALECALTALWASLGIRPGVVLGHSLGEFAAAQAAGVFGLEEGLRFVAARGELTSRLPAGAMAAVFADAPQVKAAIDEHNAGAAGVGLSIAAYNGAHQVVSGPEEDVAALSERFLAEEIRVNRLHTRNAFHSPLVEPMLDELGAVASGLEMAPPSLPLVSNVTGRVLESGERLDGAYWRRHTREPVAFAPSIETLASLGVDLIVEIGPHAVLGSMATLAWPDGTGGSGPPAALSSMLRPSSRVSQEEADRAFFAAVAKAWEAGLPVSLAGLFAGEERRRISLPGYPFQLQSHWVEAPRRQRPAAGHPLLGSRHESADGEVAFDTEVFPSDPAWLEDHRVFGRLLAPGALYGAMAVSASVAEGSGRDAVEDVQLHNPLVFPEEEGGDGSGDPGRRVQILLDGSGEERRIRILSRGDSGDEWTLHAEGRVSPDAGGPPAEERPDLEGLKTGLAPRDVAAIYRAKAGVGIVHGPSFRTLEAVWSGAGEALGEVALPAGVDPGGIEAHPLLLDGCFQVMAAARDQAGSLEGVTYLPFGWERLWIEGALPERIVCHARMSGDWTPSPEAESEPPEVLTGDLRIYDPGGDLLGGLDGYTVKRATREALLSVVEGLDELLYEVVWRDGVLSPGMPSADFLPGPSSVAPRSEPFSRYLSAEGVGVEEEAALQADLERLSWSYALSTLEKLGWQRTTGAAVDPEGLRQDLEVLPNHSQLFRRILEILARSGVVEAAGEGFVVAVGAQDPLPEGMPGDPDEHAASMSGRYAHGTNEVGLIRRCAGALAEVLRGREDPLSLLFGDAEPQAADLYRRAPVWKAANRMLGEVVQTIAAGLPEGRRLRVLEVGAGIGSATECVLPGLPAGRFDYTYTDISAGFFADAEARFSQVDAPIEYRVLDIEKEPAAQGFESHAYDLLIAANVLHATQYLDETLMHCRELLAPAGQLVALENQRGRGWMDLIFGQLDGWWRFADRYRSDHALAGPDVWRRALADTGFGDVQILGVDESESAGLPDRGVIVAQGPVEVVLPPAAWVLAQDRGGAAEALAHQLAARNQTVVLAGGESPGNAGSAPGANGVVRRAVEIDRRESWRSLLEELPGDLPLGGIVHLAALDGHGAEASTEEMGEDARRAAATALALTQGVIDADLTPEKGVWFVTRGAQVLERERAGQLAGATLWGFGRVVAREAGQVNPKMLDLDPEAPELPADLSEELLFPDSETQVAYRAGRRRLARLVRTSAPLALPEGSDWLLAPGPGGVVGELEVKPLPARSLEPRQVRVAVEARGLNFLDVFRAMGLVGEGLMGEEMCGRIVEVGSETSTVSVGDRVVGLAFGTFGPEVVTREELVAPAPAGIPVAALATIPTVFVTSALSFDLAGLKAGEGVLIHAAAGGVGLAAVQLAQAAGAEVFATASAPKQAYLRSLGVKHIFDSRSTDFGREILEATDGAGVDVVLNSLTGEGFIEASLSCLRQGGRFVELARRDILSEEEMAAARPDVGYSILEMDVLKEQEPARPGAALRKLMERLGAGELEPLIHCRWPLAEAGAAMEFMRDARHIGKIVLTAPPLAEGRLRPDRTYLVTGGLGGIGCALAGWLAERGAGAIVLNGRRAPDAEAEETIAALQERGVTVRVELADVTDAGAVDAMLERIKGDLPPLGGVIHSVGVLADASLANQTWERIEQVLWPKVLGAWHLHRATADSDLDLFVLFSSVAGILGNPGQANHAAANAFLDQLAAHRRALGLPGQAIAWGAWSGLGEAEEQRERIARRREAAGTGWFSPEQGLGVLDRLLREDPATSVVLAADWSVFGEALEGRPSLFDDLLPADEDASEDSQGTSEDLLSQLGAAPAETREDLLVSFLQQEVQAVLRLPTSPEPAVGFFDLGIDSLMAVELRNRLNRAFAGEYAAPNTVVFDYPDIAALARHLAGELGDVSGAPALQAQPEPQEQPPAVQREGDGIAIVGMACRFPGAPNLAAFWRQLEAGADAVTDNRWSSSSWSAPELSGDFTPYRQGGFLEGIDEFDARFFRIVPVEARGMDPQQRLLLETSWQALEDAGIDADGLRGSLTGVYAGIATSEYRDLMAAGEGDISYLGTSGSMTVGRVSFVLGLEGPTMPVELNCASSLVAVHQAVTGLGQGEVDLALVGGVNAVLSPGLTREMAELGMLSPEGRCKSFDAAADGFVRGEGCGMVVLKRLGDAEAAGDRIWGVIRGSAVNQNGATAGPTVPNGPAQERVIEQALSRAGVPPAEVDYLEAHGAGSALGDPIEVQAASAVYGRGREEDRPLLIGSVKTNIGHLETAAGVAGLIKTVLAMRRGRIPRQLHFHDPNPHLDWERLPVRVTSEATDWPLRPDRPPRAAVSAFGVSGTNAHVVVEGREAAEDPLPAGPAQPVTVSMPGPLADLPLPEPGSGRRRMRLLPLSGKEDGALRELARGYLAWLDERSAELSSEATGEALLADMAWTAGVGRSHFDHRTGVVFGDAASLRSGLRSLEEGEGRPESTATTRVAFAYTGEDSQWAGMGLELYESEPVVRGVLDRCDAVLREERGGASLLEMMSGGGPDGALDDPAWTPAALYSLQCALTALWSSVGIRPGAVVGPGLGELAAARAAGVFSLEEGLRFAAARGDGGPDGPDSAALAPPSLPLVSSATGRVMEAGAPPDGAYWHRQAREQAAFDRCVETLAELGVQVVVEIGPDAVLAPMVPPAWPESAEGTPAPAVLSSLTRHRPGDDAFARAVAAAYEAGLAVSFAGLFAGEARRRVALPGYPFQRRSHWIETPGDMSPG